MAFTLLSAKAAEALQAENARLREVVGLAFKHTHSQWPGPDGEKHRRDSERGLKKALRRTLRDCRIGGEHG